MFLLSRHFTLRTAACSAVAALTFAGLMSGIVHHAERFVSGHHFRVAEAAPAALREFTLVAQEVDWEIMPGMRVKAWTFGGTMPGPEIRATEGDLIRVTLQNQLPVPTTIHWHGVDVPFAMDGVPGLTQESVPPGGTFVYEFTATNPGTRWYHSHQDGEVQVPLGLFGPFIIDHRSPPEGSVQYDREYTYLLSEWALALTPAVAKGEAALPTAGHGAPHAKQLDFDLFLLNGKAHDAIPPVVLKEGERVRIRLINAGQLPHTMHSHGHSFKVIASDGNFIPPAHQLVKDSVTIGPSERVDIEIYAHNPGIWMFHCHMQHHAANGMMTTIRYEGVEPLVAAHQHISAPAAVMSASPVQALSANDTAVLGATKILMVDSRFQPADQRVKAGSSIAWINNGANIHTISSFDGRIESGSVLTGKAFIHKFDTPGIYPYLCRQHLLNGMTGRIVVE
jgi:FtsP/CotA-like multicopper oxidase with cupredoxin domain/plastocyanin